MTRKQKAIIERARLTPARFVEIPRLARHTAGDNANKQFVKDGVAAVTALLNAEQRRIVKTWREGTF